MDKSEPTLVPEWLKNAGSLAGGGSMSHLDDRATSRVVRNKPSANGHDFGKSSSDMTTSSYFRRSSNSNGSGHLRPYSSFGRNQRDKEWEKETYSSRDRGRVVLGNRRHRDFSDSPGSIFSSTFERDSLRNSQSIVSGKQNDTWQKNFNSASENKNNGLYIRNNPVREVKKETFEKDFPSLGADDKAVHEFGRVPSPSISSAIHSLPIGSSVSIGGEKWTSALAEVPVLAVSNGTPSSSMAVVSDTHTGLNMAKTVAQGPSRAQTTPQSSVGTQRLEELAIKQSRQLIPVTPALPKTLVVNTSDKVKNKLGQHHLSISSSFPVTHSPRGGPMNGDMSKTLNGGKLHVLKPVVREKNGVSPKDTSSPTNGTPVLGSKGPPYKPSDRKPVLTVLEKRPTPQALSRNDFFNQMRKKSVLNSSSVPDSAVSNSSPGPDKVNEMEAVLAPSTPQAGGTQLSENASREHLSDVIDDMACNGVDSQGKKHPSADRIFSEEEEAAFLRSMGWEENADEDGLTEEEINEFYRDATKYINSKPSLKILEGVRSKFLSPLGCVSSGVSPSGAKLES